MFRLSRVCQAALVLLAIFICAYTSHQMYAHQQNLKEGSRYNEAWSTSQAVLEFSRLQMAIAMVARGGSTGEVALRYDIFLNRLQLMSGGDNAAFLAAHPVHGATVRGVEAVVTRLHPLVNAIDQPKAAEQAAAMLAPLLSGLIAVASAANRHGGERVAADEAILFSLHWIFTGQVGALIGGAIALIVLLTRRMADLRATKETLEATAERLTGALVRADAASQAKATFLATMSHEIRTPLNAMLGLTTSLLDEVKGGPQRALLETIRDAGDSLLRLLNDILDFSKLDAGRLTFEETAFCPGALAANIASVLEPRAKAKSISMFVLTGPDLPAGMMGDPGRIEQILINLVSNAVKFTERGHVTIQTVLERAEDDKATIIWRISDTGIGIPADRVGQLFSDFMQADNSITRRFGGTGLGLAISKRLIDDMNGTIEVNSIAGAGTSFTVRLTLPVVSSPIAEAPAAHDTVSLFEAMLKRLGRPLRILFVEDNPTNQYVATQLMKGFNVHLDMAGNGLEALDSVSRFTHDLICMDMRMPEMDGLEATRQIRRMGGRIAVIPIIALTANAFKDDVDACIDAGMNRFVSKPVRRDVLLGAMLAELAKAPVSIAPALDVDDLLEDFPLTLPGLSASDPAPNIAHLPAPPAFDAVEFDGLIDMIGDHGVMEMIKIFEAETRLRLRRLGEGNQDMTIISREMHTLKGAAGTVAAPRLAALGRAFEQAANQGIPPTAADIQAMEDALAAFLTECQRHDANRAAA